VIRHAAITGSPCENQEAWHGGLPVPVDVAARGRFQVIYLADLHLD